MDNETEPDDGDHVACQRCGATGLYWQERWLPDGSSKYRLYDSADNKVHVCPVKDGFSVVVE